MATTTKSAKPLVLSDGEARALVKDRRVELRRAIKDQPGEGLAILGCHYSPTGWAYSRPDGGCSCWRVLCPYVPGARFWGKEAWSPDHAAFYPNFPVVYRSAGYPADWEIEKGQVESPEAGCRLPFRWRSSTTMPRSHSRFDDLIVAPGTRAERGERGWEWVFTVERETNQGGETHGR